jgi:hypothetical protein
MIIHSFKYVDKEFHSIVRRMEGELELIEDSENQEVVSVNLTKDNDRFYGVVFCRFVEKKNAG